MLKSFILGFSLLVSSAGTLAQALDLDVLRADENSFYAGSVLVSGETEAVLIDAQFTRANAHRLVARILDSGKTLTAIYISHGDPDYYFGLETIQEAFPDVAIYASEPTLAHIRKTSEQKLAYWGPKLGANAPEALVMPEPLPGDTLTVDGKVLEVKGLDGPSPERSFVWIPSLKAVVGGVVLYNDVHLWLADSATTEERQEWLDIVDRISALEPEVVVAGHAMPAAATDISAVNFTRDYLTTFNRELVDHQQSDTLIERMEELYPAAGLDIALELGAKVTLGEMSW
ncbi:MBL fold metallo-hydrolase [Marinobacter sp. 71-i]|uniref:MBL fold metallo-hydrolase n=1 Tax=Marinobacter iranensis TaxID=2962607 RepID=A0ABT5YCS6_9GAMM|nr:MBL fold metallo-hydrolase [Marinobacter iranensis]MDF0751491.1 MBL fold metallo-hydrolase [Marinobacter iranensis]